MKTYLEFLTRAALDAACFFEKAALFEDACFARGRADGLGRRKKVPPARVVPVDDTDLVEGPPRSWDVDMGDRPVQNERTRARARRERDRLNAAYARGYDDGLADRQAAAVEAWLAQGAPA